MEPHQEKKLDDLLAGMNQLIPQVNDTKDDVHYLRSNSKRIEIKVARLEEKHGNLQHDVDQIGGKVREHMGNSLVHRAPSDSFTDATVRWKFIGAVAGGLMALVALVTFLARFMP